MIEENNSECIDIIEIGTRKGLSANKISKIQEIKNRELYA